jgi:predicted NUDIX family phosphoesterase
MFEENNEEVLVFPGKLLKLEDGFNTDRDKLTELISKLGESFFLDRAIAEVNEKNKQIIPYIIIRHKDKVLCYCRTKESGESRLHDKWSIGIGGHINPVDGEDSIAAFNNAIKRELDEELSMEKDVEVESWFLGTLYDSTDSVGRVHLGIVVAMLIKDEDLPEIKPEDTIREVKWLTREELKEVNDLENWSKLIVNSF